MCKSLTLFFAAGTILAAADTLAILPNTIELNGPEARHHLLAEATLAVAAPPMGSGAKDGPGSFAKR